MATQQEYEALLAEIFLVRELEQLQKKPLRATDRRRVRECLALYGTDTDFFCGVLAWMESGGWHSTRKFADLCAELHGRGLTRKDDALAALRTRAQRRSRMFGQLWQVFLLWREHQLALPHLRGNSDWSARTEAEFLRSPWHFFPAASNFMIYAWFDELHMTESALRRADFELQLKSPSADFNFAAMDSLLHFFATNGWRTESAVIEGRRRTSLF